MAEYPGDPPLPDDPNRDIDFINQWDQVTQEMLETDFSSFYYEDWLADLNGHFRDFDITARVKEPILIRLAYDCGVRKAHDLMSRVHLESVDFSLSHEGVPWFEQARKLYHQGTPDSLAQAAEIFINHGIKKAYCCQGFEPSCKLQQAINYQLHRWN